MPRNRQFQPEKEPLRHHRYLQLDTNKVYGPFSFLDPTYAHFQHVNNGVDTDEAFPDSAQRSNQPASQFEYRWSSRNNRKGRHTIAVTSAPPLDSAYNVPPKSSGSRQILRGLWRMVTYYPIWDVSYLVAVIFTLGSVVWVFNAFFVFLPLVRPDTEFPNELLYGGGITAFIGATIFEIGSVLLMLEAINENNAGCFGWALERAWKEHKNGGYSTSDPSPDSIPSINNKDTSSVWTWWPSAYDVKTRYIHDIGFLACLFQLFGATIFWIAGFTALPGIYNNMSQGLIDGIYWTPQVIGGSGFVISGTLFMLETQKKWYIPAPKVLGWHIGLWNWIGGLGFTLSPCFGYDTASWAQYQAACSTYWGSWAFLIGSAIQWYESLDKHPVESQD
ncbi:hypothetical protein LTR66_004903 [Elasticomyces elasticus]|nr:hypothetical protein LTR50_000280 [Elasticomyces elasticus]KAK4995242.1 hypothetical protein LTR66_004903 [Elasticomyces elasticus]